MDISSTGDAAQRSHARELSMSNTTGTLTYSSLAAMAVTPSDPGAYSHSPLGMDTGLHIHPHTLDVHVVVGGRKIAEVYPSKTDFYPASSGRQREIQDMLPQ